MKSAKKNEDGGKKQTDSMTACLYYLEKGCRHGDRCKNLHPAPSKTAEAKPGVKSNISRHQKPCFYYCSRGYCKFGDQCHFLHDSHEDSVVQYENHSAKNGESSESFNQCDGPSNRNERGDKDKRFIDPKSTDTEETDLQSMMKEVAEHTKMTNNRINFLEELMRKMIYR